MAIYTLFRIGSSHSEKYLRLSPEEYNVICKSAIKQTKEAEKFVVTS
jgi:hypothetical protein